MGSITDVSLSSDLLLRPRSTLGYTLATRINDGLVLREHELYFCIYSALRP